MSLPEEELTGLFRARRTALQMLRDRGYAVEESELAMTRKDFIEKFGRNMRREDFNILKSKSDDPSNRIYVVFPGTNKTGAAMIKDVAESMQHEEVWNAIVIHPKALIHTAKKALLEERHVRIEFFEESELLVNVTEHALVPRHRVLSDEEKKALFIKYTVKETQLPRILVTDPVARYYGLKRGQVVQITRESETAKTYHTYRYCV